MFAKYQQFYQEYDDVSVLDTRTFLQGMKIGQEVSVELEHGKTLFVKLNGVGEVDATGHRDVIFELNGQQRVIKTKDLKANVKVMVRPKAEMGKPGSVGAPMPGLVVSTITVFPILFPPFLGGKGGGRPDMAQGSGADASGIDKALAAVEKMVKAALVLAVYQLLDVHVCRSLMLYRMHLSFSMR